MKPPVRVIEGFPLYEIKDCPIRLLSKVVLEVGRVRTSPILLRQGIEVPIHYFADSGGYDFTDHSTFEWRDG